MDRVTEIQSLANQGYSLTQISEDLGVSRGVVSRAKWRLGFETQDGRVISVLEQVNHRRVIQGMSATAAVEYLLGIIETEQPAQDENRLYRVTRFGFTPLEAMLLLTLSAKSGVVLKDTLMGALYGARMDPPELKILDVLLCKVRKKIKHLDWPCEIKTVWGQGYELIRYKQEPLPYEI